jgi:hypothetical protein
MEMIRAVLTLEVAINLEEAASKDWLAKKTLKALNDHPVTEKQAERIERTAAYHLRHANQYRKIANALKQAADLLDIEIPTLALKQAWDEFHRLNDRDGGSEFGVV